MCKTVLSSTENGAGPLNILPKRTKKKRTSKVNTTILAIRLGQNTFPNDITFF
jgi:hypothetical protein